MCWDETTPDYTLLTPVPLQYSTIYPSTTIIEEKNTTIVERFLHIAWQVMWKRKKNIYIKNIISLGAWKDNSQKASIILHHFYDKNHGIISKNWNCCTKTFTLAFFSYTSHHANERLIPAFSRTDTPRLLPINLKRSLSFQIGHSWDEPTSGGFCFVFVFFPPNQLYVVYENSTYI